MIRIVIALVVSMGMLAATGCDPSVDSEVARPIERRSPHEPDVQRFSLGASTGTSAAVAVQGYPLVFTRQILPLDKSGALVGEGDPAAQVGQVMDQLETVLVGGVSGLDRIVRLNIYGASRDDVHALRGVLAQRFGMDSAPAVTSVVTPLPVDGAVVAVDAVAIASSDPTDVVRTKVPNMPGDLELADLATAPIGGFVYLSGFPDKSPRREATHRAMEGLLALAGQLQLDRSAIARIKVFIDSASQADVVTEAIREHFPQGEVPPLVFVEWIASAPIEIEMVLHRPLGDRSSPTIRYYNPPEVKPSPTFSRAVIVDTDRQIFTTGLVSGEPGDGDSQVRDVFSQLREILGESSSDFDHLAKATYYVSDEEASTKLNELRPEFYDPARPPAASKVMVHGVGAADRSLALDMIAVPRVSSQP